MGDFRGCMRGNIWSFMEGKTRMRNHYAPLFILIMVFGLHADDLKNVFSIDPIQLVFGRVELTYERALVKHHGISMAFIYEGLRLKNEYHFRMDLGYSFSLKDNFQGFWLNPKVSYFNATLYDSNSNIKKLITLEPCLGIGYRWVFFNRLYLAVGAGIGPSIEIFRDEYIMKRQAYFYSISDVGIVF
jgi:hypothetical protein